MKCLKPVLGILLFSGCLFSAMGQPKPKPVMVIVHGAWGGSWAFKTADSILTERGFTVYRPSLTGQGERVHLASRDIGLQTHINDVVNMILYEDLHDIILVGHSYGGMVVTGVADSLAGRIKKLVYLDAFLPANGESLIGMRGGNAEQMIKMNPTGFLVPQWIPKDKLPPKDVPHPLKTLTDTLWLKNDLRAKIASSYILTVAKGTKPEADDFASHAERARKLGWPVWQLEADHNPQWSAVGAFVDLLEKIGKQ